MLVMVKEGLMEKMTEKLWFARINTWLRGPSMSIYLLLGWQNWVLSSDKLYPGAEFLLPLVVFLHFYNGQHYNQEAIGGYYKWKTINDIKSGRLKLE